MESPFLKMDLEHALAKFLAGYFSTCRRAAKTRAAYSADVAQFRDDVGAATALERIEGVHVEHWAESMKARGYAPASLRRKVASLRVFFSYWVRMGLLQRSPLLQVKLDLGVDRVLLRALPAGAVQGLLSAAYSDQASRERHRGGMRQLLQYRNRAIVEVLFATGMRVGELVRLVVGDLSMDDGTLLVNGKGRRQRLAVLVDDRSRRALDEYISLRASIDSKTDALFLSVKRKPLATQGVAAVVARLAASAGISRRVTPHMLRHSIATLLLSNGADVRIVQEFLGHASISTTQRYTHVSKENLRARLLRTHPNLLQTRRRSRDVSIASHP